MKKVFSILIAIVVLLSVVPVCASDGYEEFSVDYASPFSRSDTVLMNDVLEELEERLVSSWEKCRREIDISDLNIAKSDITSLYAEVFFSNPYYYYVQRSFCQCHNPAVHSVQPVRGCHDQAGGFS